MEPAWEHEWTRKHLVGFDPREDGFARIFSQFKLHRSLGLALDHRNALPNAVVFYQVRNGQFHEIAAAQLAVDGHVEQSQIG